MTKLLWALGYHVPEVHLASLRPDQLTIGEQAKFSPPTDASGRSARRISGGAWKRTSRSRTARIACIASKALAGRPVGGFRFYGTRSDDPNDLVAARASPRAARLRHVCRLAEPRRFQVDQYARHRSSITTAARSSAITCWISDRRSAAPASIRARRTKARNTCSRARRRSREFRASASTSRVGAPLPVTDRRSVGGFPSDNAHWDPEEWRPRYANSAFRAARLDDKFWAALRLQGFTARCWRPSSRAAGSTIRPRRRCCEVPDRTTRCDRPALSPGGQSGRRRAAERAGALTFRNAAVEADVAASPTEYVVTWSRFDNDTGATTRIGDIHARGTNMPAPGDLPSATGTYMRVEIAATGGPASWAEPAHAYFRREAVGWTLVGFERVPGGNPPGHRRSAQ